LGNIIPAGRSLPGYFYKKPEKSEIISFLLLKILIFPFFVVL